MRALLAALACLTLVLFARSGAAVAPPWQSRMLRFWETKTQPLLSAFGFFGGAADQPSRRLIAYTLATPLFSDYAEKQRFIYLPQGRISQHRSKTASSIFPIGTAIVKSFGYPDASGKVEYY